MTRQEALKAMKEGKKVRHEYYSPEEFLFINQDGNFQTEDGCIHGWVSDEFWSVWQKWPDGWDLVIESDHE
jgi:hypothetical protein